MRNEEDNAMTVLQWLRKQWHWQGEGRGQGKRTSIDIYNDTKQHTLLCKEERGDGDYAWRRHMREFDDEVFLGDAIRLAAHQIEVWKLVIKVWKRNQMRWICKHELYVVSESIRERRKQWSEVEEKWWNGMKRKMKWKYEMASSKRPNYCLSICDKAKSRRIEQSRR